jgi:hypothetical protein
MSSIFNLPFPEAEAFFKDKLNIPTERWNDLMGSIEGGRYSVLGGEI